MLGNARVAMIARLALIGAAGYLMAAQSSCSYGDAGGQLVVADPGGGTGTNTGPTFETTLTLRDSSGATTSHVRRGEVLTFELAVLNRTNAPITVQFPSMGGYADFQVFDRGTDHVRFDWLADKAFAAVVTDITFAAHGMHTFTGTWDTVDPGGATVAAGAYEAAGTWLPVHDAGLPLTSEDTRSPRVAFSVD